MLATVDQTVDHKISNYASNLPTYQSLGGAIFPCHRCVIGDPASKAPLHDGNLERDYSDEELVEYLESGHALGWSPGTAYVVMDVDVATPERPEKRGKQSLQKLKADTGLDLSEVPYVESPSGGRHYYFRRPDGIKLRKTVPDDYPDIEFISGRNYVLTAGSPHWQGGSYELCEDAQAFGLEPAQLPDGLLAVLEKTTSAAQHRVISDDHLAELLSHLDPNDYSGYDEWLDLAMASHSATGGSGLAEFNQWSLGGDAYSSEHRVEQQWESFDAEEEDGITIGTLFTRIEDARELMEPSESAAAQATPHKVKAEIEFAGIDTEQLVLDNLTEDEIEELPEKITPVDIHLSQELRHNQLRLYRRTEKDLPELFRHHGVYPKSGVLVEVMVDADPSDPESRQLQFKLLAEPKLAAILSSKFHFLKSNENDEGLWSGTKWRCPGFWRS